MVAEALALDERRPLRRLRAQLAARDAPRDAAGLRRVLEEVWEQFGTPDVRATLPLYLEIMSASLMHPERYGPVMRDVITGWTDLAAGRFAGLGMPAERARGEATLVVGAGFGLLFAAPADGDRDRADAAFRLLLDRLEPGWRQTAQG
ncbi:TetR/AcrR family transcriptional regulator [Streptomyces sp. NPDC090445]|uniref:TetR/AcrR family transcriptional regulator n=1 Tax=Streptomyces sp. NPDC090445 TaxID=3365963 RepID=UPI00382C8337